MKNRSNRLQQFAENIVSAISDDKQLLRERERIIRQYEAMKSELRNYENNLGFLNAASKTGNSILNELNKKVEKIKEDLKTTLEKVDIIDQKLKKE